MELIHQLRQIFSIQGYKTEILAALSAIQIILLNVLKLVQMFALARGVNLRLLKHPLTDIGLG
jgi:hypothetical protein